VARKKLDNRDRITTSPAAAVGKPVLRGSRTPVERVRAHLTELHGDGERALGPSFVSPEAFDQQLSSRADVGEILTPLAKWLPFHYG
jgi:hypothetical protein